MSVFDVLARHLRGNAPETFRDRIRSAVQEIAPDRIFQSHALEVRIVAVKVNVWEGNCMVWGKGTRSQRGERSQDEGW